MIARIGLVFLAIALTAQAATSAPRHGISTFGELKYPADFKHFDYVNPNAPKGGQITTLGTEGRLTFDSLNGYILKGEPAQKLDLLFDTLMVRAFDEPDAMYGLVAHSAEVAKDKMSVVFYLRKEATFSDGTALTATDVAFSFRLLKEKGHPNYRTLLRDVKGAEIIDPQTIRYRFKGNNVRDLPLIIAALPIFSKVFYTKNDFTKTSLKPPLGSGPYRISDSKQGQFITYERRADYWAKALPVNIGQYNFAVIKLLYFRDRNAELEALKAKVVDLREEFSSKSWAKEYDIEQVRDGRLIKATLPDDNASGAQGFFINMRRAKFANIKTRQALDLAFDFKWSNKNLFYGLYKRTTSFFENSTMKATGKPHGDELMLLRDREKNLRPSVFGEVYVPPVSDGSGQDRALLRKAVNLLSEAGWVRKNGKLVSATGKPLTIEFLIVSPSFERIITPFVRNLRLLGIDANIRLVEAAQYQERLKRFDYDIITQRYVVGQTPGTELNNYFSSRVADLDGGLNLAGVKNVVVDDLINVITQAKDRRRLITATRALDRVLRAEHFWVPHWYKASHNIVYWNIFGRPAKKPKFDRGVFATWWIDPKKPAALEK